MAFPIQNVPKPVLVDAVGDVLEQDDLLVPFVEAAPEDQNANFDRGDEEKGEVAESSTTTRRVFEVVAPRNLPGGYRLPVTVAATTLHGEEEISVMVPPGGVQKRETFLAHEALRITKRWSDSAFDFNPSMEGNFFCVALCIPFVGWAFVMKKLGRNPCFRVESVPNHSHVVPCLAAALTLFCYSRSPLSIIALLYLISMVVAARGAVRKKYNIPGSMFLDCVMGYSCAPCTLLQSYRHMKRNGDDPWKGCGGQSTLAIQV